jgi:Flp pilus assembly protein TadG
MPNAGRAGERGTAAVEFALVLPLILVLTLALVQVGLLARDRVIVEAAARAGARTAAVDPSTDAIRAAALAAGPGLDPAATSVQVMRAGGRGSPVTVTVDVEDAIRVPFIGWLLGSSVHFRAEATDRQEFG